MKLLFMHPNMPGQYKHLCPAFAADNENQVVFITKREKIEMEGVHKVMYQLRRGASPHTHRYLHHTENAILQGQEVWRCLKKLRDEEGFVPDVVVAHPGWGDALYVKDIYPDTPLFSFFEYYYHADGADVGFDPNEPASDDDKARVRTKNLPHLLNLVTADWGIAPTFWQHTQLPPEFHQKVTVIHDGVDVEAASPNPDARYVLKTGKGLGIEDEVITYIARNFEPYRGFPTFMQAAEIILKARPNCRIVAVGADDISYGKRAPGGRTYREIWLDKVQVDRSRLHFVGQIPHAELMKLLQISSAHLYLTYPFVLSWSLLESMACGCAVVASDTQPVREVIRHGENGYLADFFSPEAVAEQIIKVLENQDEQRGIREKARADIVHKYDLKKLLPMHMDLVREVAAGQLPPPTHDKVMALYG